MKKSFVPALIILAATLTACGDFEWFPEVGDSTAPVVSAIISGATFQNRSSTTIASVALPATVSFSADEAATVYYTTNGSEPSTSSSSADFSSTPVTGPVITVTNTLLKFFGIDKSPNQNKSVTQTIRIVSP